MIEINSYSIRSRFITCTKEIPFYIYKFGGGGGGDNGASTARLYIFVECAYFLQSLFQQNKTKARLGRLLALSLEILKETRSVTMNIFRKKKKIFLNHL